MAVGEWPRGRDRMLSGFLGARPEGGGTRMSQRLCPPRREHGPPQAGRQWVCRARWSWVWRQIPNWFRLDRMPSVEGAQPRVARVAAGVCFGPYLRRTSQAESPAERLSGPHPVGDLHRRCWASPEGARQGARILLVSGLGSLPALAPSLPRTRNALAPRAGGVGRSTEPGLRP